MHPRLLDIPTPFGSIPIHSYGFMLMLGFAAAMWVAGRRAKRDGFPPEYVLDLGVLMMLGGVVGSRLAYLFEFREDFNWRLFDLGDGGLSWAGAALGAVLPVAYHLGWVAPARRRAAKPVISAVGAVGLLISMLVAGLAAGRVLFWSQHREFFEDPLKGSPLDIVKIWQGGMILYGGLLLGVPLGCWFTRRRGLSVLVAADLILPNMFLGLAFGRIGCWMNGCCFGRPAEGLAWAVRWPKVVSEHGIVGTPAFLRQLQDGLIGPEAGCSLPTHPTQLYSSGADILVFAILSLYWARRPAPGKVMALFGISYSVTRFLLECWRGDNVQHYGGLTMAQAIGVGLFVISLGAWFLIPSAIFSKSENS